jgi:hypothetical protein
MILPFLTGAAARGLPVKILAAVTKSSSYFMVAQPEIEAGLGSRRPRPDCRRSK